MMKEINITPYATNPASFLRSTSSKIKPHAKRCSLFPARLSCLSIDCSPHPHPRRFRAHCESSRCRLSTCLCGTISFSLSSLCLCFSVFVSLPVSPSLPHTLSHVMVSVLEPIRRKSAANVPSRKHVSLKRTKPSASGTKNR